MLFKFKQAVNFDGKDYKRGVHEVPESLHDNPHFLVFVKAGWIEEVEPSKMPVSPSAPHERSKRLYEKLMKKKAEPEKLPEPPFLSSEEEELAKAAGGEMPHKESGSAKKHKR